MTLHSDADRFLVLFVVVWEGRHVHVSVFWPQKQEILWSWSYSCNCNCELPDNLTPLEEQYVLFAAAPIPPTSSFYWALEVCVGLLTSVCLAFWLILLFHRGSWATRCSPIHLPVSKMGSLFLLPSAAALWQGFAWVHHCSPAGLCLSPFFCCCASRVSGT